MGERVGNAEPPSPHERRRFTEHLLRDLRALEIMIDSGAIEADPTRLGVEQEIFLVDRSWEPAPLSLEVLQKIDDERFTTELGRFNLEFNLPPIPVGGDCLGRLERDVDSLLGQARAAAARVGARVVLTGILPTLTGTHLSLEYMTPRSRYLRLNDAMNRLRGRRYELRIKGRDELLFHHDNVMLEACNTSFQVHLQISAQAFAQLYNIAQLVAAPVLACATNSPLLFDRQLWSETRIALFQQSVDTRAPELMAVRQQPARVSFGTRWLDESVVEIFREDIARMAVVLPDSPEEDALQVLREGSAPRLTALCRHNGTVYRWNRPCYGISEGRPHLRIENRYLPSGPTVQDEVANASFWIGLMKGAWDEYGDVRRRFAFDRARSNFLAAARVGLEAQFVWVDGARRTAQELVLDELLPLAREGLRRLACRPEAVERYLGTIRERVRSGRTGSHWLCEAHDRHHSSRPPSERMAALVETIHRQQAEGAPVHTWRLPEPHQAMPQHYQRVSQIMTTDLFTVQADELIDLAAHVMDWQHIRHIPVEDETHRLVGIVSHRSLLRRLVRRLTEGVAGPSLVRDIMETDVVTTTPDTPTLEALRVMRKSQVSCLPVIDEEGMLLGIVTERDLMTVAGPLLERFLTAGPPGGD
jgi:CBS domain-containing protein